MRRFVSGDVDGSLNDFDRAIDLDPGVRPYLWQRGLALYYAGRYEEAAAQFLTDVRVNPSDTEEAIWHLLARARVDGLEEARKGMLRVGEDPRPVMRAVYDLFATGSEPALSKVLQYARGPGRDAFYARLYLGLLAEAGGEDERARGWISAALERPCNDYMYLVGKVHAGLRGSEPAVQVL